MFESLVAYIERGEIRPLVARTFPLKDIAQAQEEFLAKKFTASWFSFHPVEGSYHEDRPYRRVPARHPAGEAETLPEQDVRVLDDTIVRLETDAGLVGWSEVCPIASTYQPEHALGVRAAIEEDGAGADGPGSDADGRHQRHHGQMADGWRIREVRHRHRVLGHRRQGLRQAALSPHRRSDAGEGSPLPGDRDGRTRCCRTANFAIPGRGHTHFQVKAGRGSNLDLDMARIRRAEECIRPCETLVVDANKAWKTHEALRILRATEDIDYYIEQPCLTYEECSRSVARYASR